VDDICAEHILKNCKNRPNSNKPERIYLSASGGCKHVHTFPPLGEIRSL